MFFNTEATVLESLLPYIFLAITVGLTYQRYGQGLIHIDGPFLASFSNIWRAWYLCDNKNVFPIAELHVKYGQAVRIGPRVISFNNPDAIRTIYNRDFVKSGLYSCATGVNKGLPVQTLFSVTDEVYAEKLRRSLAGVFSMTTVAQYEPFVDVTIDKFMETIGQYADKEGPEGVLDMQRWMRAYAFDVIGELTYSERHGFLDRMSDMDEVVNSLRIVLRYRQKVGTMPGLDRLLWKNPILLWLSKRGWHDSSSPTMPFAVRQLRKRLASSVESVTTKHGETEDLMAKFLQAKHTHPDMVNDSTVLGLALAMTNAGADTPAITLTAFFYFMLRNPRCMAKLKQEFNNRLPRNHTNPSSSIIKFHEAQQLPYLDACMKETFRLHPAVSLFLERVVPMPGASICGYWIPGNTIVGCDAFALHRNRAVYGDDVEVFRPERWLEDPDKGALRQRSLFHFGAGTHTCLGKNISLLEMYKLIPTLTRKFEMTLAEPEKEWTTWNTGFMEITDFNIRIQKRSDLPRADCHTATEEGQILRLLC